MKPSIFAQRKSQKSLVLEYEAMSHNKNVPLFEEAAFWRIANYYYEHEQFELALEVAQCALRQYEDAFRFHILKAILCLELDLPERCMQSLKRVQGYAAEAELPTIFRAEALCQSGHYTSTKNILIEMLNFSRQDEMPDLHSWNKFVLCSLFLNGGQFDVLAEQALRQPNNPALLEEIWLNVEILQNYQESIALHETLLDINPYSSRAWFNLGEAYLQLNEWEESYEAFEYAFLIDAEMQEAYLRFVTVAMKLNKVRSAIVVIEEMIARFGEDPENLTLLGWCYHQLSDVSIAKYLFEKALKIDPFYVETYYRKGLMFLQLYDYRSAAKWLQQGYMLDNDREDIATALAEALKCSGKMEEALELYWRAVEIDPLEQKNWRHVIQFYTHARDFKESLDIIEQAFENCTDRNELNYIFSANLLLSGQRKKGLSVLKKAVKSDPTSKSVLFEVAPELYSDKKVLEILGYSAV